MSEPARRPQLPEPWLRWLEPEFSQPYMQELRAFLVEEKRQHAVYPPGEEIFSAFRKKYTPPRPLEVFA